MNTHRWFLGVGVVLTLGIWAVPLWQTLKLRTGCCGPVTAHWTHLDRLHALAEWRPSLHAYEFNAPTWPWASRAMLLRPSEKIQLHIFVPEKYTRVRVTLPNTVPGITIQRVDDPALGRSASIATAEWVRGRAGQYPDFYIQNTTDVTQSLTNIDIEFIP